MDRLTAIETLRRAILDRTDPRYRHAPRVAEDELAPAMKAWVRGINSKRRHLWRLDG